MKENPVVVEMDSINFEGNIIPHSWYQARPLRLDSGRINMNAVVVLAEIVYWYRRGKDGEQKFRGKMFNISYEKLGKKLGLTYDQVREAVRFLREKGLIYAKPRTVNTYAGQMYNSLHLAPMPAKLREITYIVRDDDMNDEDGDDEFEFLNPQKYGTPGDGATEVSASVRGDTGTGGSTSRRASDDLRSSIVSPPRPQPQTYTETMENSETQGDTSETFENQFIHGDAGASMMPNDVRVHTSTSSGITSSGISPSGMSTYKGPARPKSPDAERPAAKVASAVKKPQPAVEDYEYEDLPF